MHGIRPRESHTIQRFLSVIASPVQASIADGPFFADLSQNLVTNCKAWLFVAVLKWSAATAASASGRCTSRKIMLRRLRDFALLSKATPALSHHWYCLT